MADVNRRVDIVIAADDKTRTAVESAKRGMGGLGTQSRTISQQMKAHWQTVKTNFLAIGATITAAILAIRKAWNLADMAAVFFEQLGALDALGQKYQVTGQQIIDSVQGAARGLISMKDAADVASRAMTLGFSPKQILEMTRASEKLSDVFQFNMRDGVNDLSNAIASGITVTLKRNLGIMLDLTKVYKDYADKMKISVDRLDEATKFQLRYNEVMRQAKIEMDELGETVDTTKDKMDRFLVALEDAELLAGQFFIRLAALFIGFEKGLASVLLTIPRLVTWPLQLIEDGLEKMGFATDRTFNTLDWRLRTATDKLLAETEDAFRVAFASIEDLAKTSGRAIMDLADDGTASAEALRAQATAELERRFREMEATFEKIKELGRKRVEADQRVRDILGEIYVSEFELKREALIKEFELIRQNASDKLAVEVALQAALADLRRQEAEDKEKKAEEERERAARLKDQKIALASDAAGGIADVFLALAETEGKINKDLFNAYKLFASAQAAIDAYGAFNIALRTLPPPWGAIQGAISLAMGLANVRRILAMQPGGGSADSSTPPGRSVAENQAAQAEKERMGAQRMAEHNRTPQIVNIHVAGSIWSENELGRALVPVINRAIADGVRA